jgi:PilX N-terminal
MRRSEKNFGRVGGRGGRRGVALVMTLILLALLSAIGLAIVLLVSGDTMINGYYSNYRGSFYAADAGINAVVESMKNAVNGAANPNAPLFPLSVPNGTQVPSSTQAEVFQSIGNTWPAALVAAYTQFQGGYFQVGDTGSWKGQFKLLTSNPNGAPILGPVQFEVEPYPLDNHACLASPNPGNPPPTCQLAGGGTATNTMDFEWTFDYPYTVTVQGTSSGGEQEQITESGVITYYSAPGTLGAGNDPSFAKWGAFITNFSDCQGPLVPGTMTGPFFTDGQWNFGNDSNPGYTFTGTVGQVGANVSWWPNGNQCQDSATAPNGFNQPVFQKGLSLSQAQITPPTDSYSQAEAVLDGKGDPPCTSLPCPSGTLNQNLMDEALKTVNGTAYTGSGNGVYIPYYTSGASPAGKACTGTSPCFGSSPTYQGGDGYGGGFYVNGNASITLSATTGGDGTQNPTQTYTITQGNTTTTIIVDNAANGGIGTTTVVSGSTTLTIQGCPTQLDPTTGQVLGEQDPSGSTVNPTIVYVNGQITGLSGTIQNDVGLTVAAGSATGGSCSTGNCNISITGDLTYASLPVSVPSDTLNSNTNAGVLGIYTMGNINLYPNQSGSNAGNLTVDAALAALSGSSGSNANSGFETPGNSINTWTIVGGRSEDHAHSVSINQGNTYYDQRFASGSFGPPWFPTAVPNAGTPPISSYSQLTVQRLSWQENRQ